LHLVGILFSHINDDARSNSHQIEVLPCVSAFNECYELCKPKQSAWTPVLTALWKFVHCTKQ